MGCKYSKDFLKKYAKKKKMEDGGISDSLAAITGGSMSEDEVDRIKSKAGDSKDPRKERGSDDKLHKQIERLRKQAYSDNPSPDLKIV